MGPMWGEKRVIWKKGQGPGEHSILVFFSCVFEFPPPHIGLVFLFLQNWSSAGVVGMLCAAGSRAGVPLGSLGEARGCWLCAWPGLCIPAHACALLCFVLSGPRLRPWQMESTNPTKVSSPGSCMGHPAFPGDGWGGPIPSFQVFGGRKGCRDGDQEGKRESTMRGTLRSGGLSVLVRSLLEIGLVAFSFCSFQ